MPCHAAVCVNCDLGSNVQFLRVITQSTGHTFLPGLPIGKKLGSNSTFMYRKTLCKVVEQCTEYIFVLSFIRLALFRQLNIKLTFSHSHLATASWSEKRVLLTVWYIKSNKLSEIVLLRTEPIIEQCGASASEDSECRRC